MTMTRRALSAGYMPLSATMLITLCCGTASAAAASIFAGPLPLGSCKVWHHMALRGGGNSMGASGEAITEEQAGEELIKAAIVNNILGLEPAGINILIQSGAPVNYMDMWKRTPLHYGAREGQTDACERLVELGGDLTAEDFLGRTPLHLAARKGFADLVVVLANLGSDINHPDRNPWPNNGGRTPMHWAAYKGHAEVVLRLIELGADKEAEDCMKRTPLHWAARRGATDCVQVLLLEGANVHAIDAKQMKPVNLANSKESNSATQHMLHLATLKHTLPTSMPAFPPQPIPQQDLHAQHLEHPPAMPVSAGTARLAKNLAATAPPTQAKAAAAAAAAPATTQRPAASPVFVKTSAAAAAAPQAPQAYAAAPPKAPPAGVVGGWVGGGGG